MSRVLIFSDNKALIQLWSSALKPKYQVDSVAVIDANIDADAIIIDTHKVDQNEHIFSFFNAKTTRALIVGTNWPENKQINVLVHGASGYCGESEPPELLRKAVECILKGDIWIQRHLVPKVIGALIQMNSSSVEEVKNSKSTESSKLLKTLTARELEVARMVQDGESNKTIASALHISERTVKAHLTSIFKKLDLSDRLHLALYIKEYG